MKSKMSFFNPGILRKNCTRFAPIWGIYLGCMFILYPLIMLNTHNIFGDNVESRYVVNYLYMVTAYVSLFIHLVYGALVAAACFGYLHKARSGYMYHAFPVTRNSLFLTNLVTGLLFALVPQLLITGLTFLVSVFSSTNFAAVLLQVQLMWILQFVFFYGLAVLFMHLSGNTIMALLMYFVSNFLVVGLEALCRLMVQPFIYGYTFSGLLLDWFSPVYYLLFRSGSVDTEMSRRFAFPCWGYLWAIAGVGVLAMVIGWLLYRRRHMESVGEIISFKPAKPLFKYLTTFAITLCLGLLLAAICDSLDNLPGLLMFLIIGSFVGYFAAEMLLKRTLRVFQAKAFRGFAIYVLVLIAGISCFRWDVFGIVSYIPPVEDVSYVDITAYGYDDARITNPKYIQQLEEIHQDCVENRYADVSYFDVTFSYRLSSGKVVRRTYLLNQSQVDAYDALLSTTEIVQAYYDRQNITAYAEGYIYDFQPMLEDPYANYNWLELNAAQLQQIKECLQKDITAGNVSLASSHDYFHLCLVQADGSEDAMGIPYTAENTVAYLNKLANS